MALQHLRWQYRPHFEAVKSPEKLQSLLYFECIGNYKSTGSDKLSPEGPSAQHLRTLVPKTMPLMVLGPGSSNIRYLDPLGKGALPS